MLALGLTLLLLDPPDWSACETGPWGADAADTLGWMRDEVVPGANDRSFYVRICGMPMGFGYTQVLVAVWDGRPAGRPANVRAEQGVTACSDTKLEPEPKGLRVRTPACAYHDEEPTGSLQTRLRWLDDAPFVTVVD
ncbi:MAG: hypothetical protein ACRBN8_13805 [Nannocystales bacterium]